MAAHNKQLHWFARLASHCYTVTTRLQSAEELGHIHSRRLTSRARTPARTSLHFTDERGLGAGHVLSPLQYLIESNDMPSYLGDDDDCDGIGHFAHDGVGIATKVAGMQRLPQRLDACVHGGRARRSFTIIVQCCALWTFCSICSELDRKRSTRANRGPKQGPHRGPKPISIVVQSAQHCHCVWPVT